MKISRLKVGDTIEVGDFIRHETDLTGKQHFPVVRVTPKYAIVMWNDVSEGRFKRVVENTIRPCGERDPYSQVRYSIWRPVLDSGFPG
jgi:hypothetical protein